MYEIKASTYPLLNSTFQYTKEYINKGLLQRTAEKEETETRVIMNYNMEQILMHSILIVIKYTEK